MQELYCLPRAGYVLGPVLGKGGFCSVRKALHELTGRTVACKIIEKSRLKVGGSRELVSPTQGFVLLVNYPTLTALVHGGLFFRRHWAIASKGRPSSPPHLVLGADASLRSWCLVARLT